MTIEQQMILHHQALEEREKRAAELQAALISRKRRDFILTDCAHLVFGLSAYPLPETDKEYERTVADLMRNDPAFRAKAQMVYMLIEEYYQAWAAAGYRDGAQLRGSNEPLANARCAH